MAEPKSAFEALGSTPYDRVKALMKTLRAPEGCPWDQVQTFKTIAPYTIEEAYEVSDAIDRNHMDDLKEELGDLLFQVVVHAEIASDRETFNLDDVCDALVQKMINRHPHVFDTIEAKQSAKQQKVAWEAMKAEERANKAAQNPDRPGSLLDDVPLALPELMRAEKLQKRAARVGFDWPNADGVLEKIIEEAHEVSAAADTQDPDALADEIGDLLFALTNLARHYKVDPELALRRTNTKFIRRFQYIEDQARQAERDVSELNLDEMETLWQAAKATDKSEA